HFSISTPIAGPLEVTLINSHGKEVLVQQTEGMEPISITHLASGVYTVKIYSEANSTYTLYKLIIAR
ncbi:MAG: T9SS type A sorting domain-containing protein, partial [Flavobacteriales bacterium]